KLERKAIDVLMYLLEKKGHVVSTSEILDYVWAKQVVEEGAVHQRISQLRKAMGDDSRHPKYIESIPRRGYRAMAEVITANGEGLNSPRQQRVRPWMLWSAIGVTGAGVGLSLLLSGATDAPSALPAESTQSSAVTIARFAVRPLVDVSGDQQLGAMASAMTQELRHQLSRYELGIWPDWTVKVAPPLATVGDFAESAADSIDYLIEGTLNRGVDGPLLKVEFTDVKAGDLLWATTFRSSESVFASPDRLASQAARLAVWFTYAIGPSGWAPKNRLAHAAFVEFLKLDGGDQLDDALFWYRRTLELDPDWHSSAEGWAWGLFGIAKLRRDPSYFQRARDAYERSGLSTFLPIEMKAYVDGELSEAEIEAREFTIRDDMAYGYAWLMLHSGLYPEGERFFRWFNEQMPHHSGGLRVMEMTSVLRDDALGAIEASQKLAGATADPVHVLWGAAWGLPRLGRLAEAQALYDDVYQLTERQPRDSLTAIRNHQFLATLAFEIAIAQGDIPGAREA
ncbi:MAG: winged helix-turn-helix domain-containing protein, partial [Pseudomonadales bacterium]|nr:winged helix-turn-helix domain-containing protein [Pseudomonadales bacterium]